VRGDATLLTRAVEAFVDITSRGSPPGACIEIDVRSEDDVAVEIRIGDSGGMLRDEPSIDPLTVSGLPVYVALQIIMAHGATVRLLPSSTAPCVVVTLPATGRTSLSVV